MEVIVKKMQAMELELDNVMDSSDTWKVMDREAKTRRAKHTEDAIFCFFLLLQTSLSFHFLPLP